jgi:hypothetical protein
MGFRCSLLGHTFDESDVNRSREVRGDEVVTVVETIERCSRCGDERVVAENKEVVSVVNAEDVDLDEEEMAAVATGEAAPPAEGTDDADGADGTVPDEPTPGDADATDVDATPDGEEGDGDPADLSSADDPGAMDEEYEPPDDPAEEDVEFITETDGSLGGGDDVNVDVDPGDVPEGGIGGMAARSGAYGDDGGTDEDPDADTGPDPEPEREPDDAEILGESGSSERAPGQWPDDPDATDEPWEPGPLDGEEESDSGDSEDVTEEPDPGSSPAQPAPKVGPDRRSGSADRLRCPSCGHTVETASSFRAGDACPECREDYLEPLDE